MRERLSLSFRGKPSPLRRFRLSFDRLEDRLTPSWGATPPSLIYPPASYTGVTQDGQGDATGTAAINSTEIDWYKFTAATSGTYVFEATTPSSSLDTVAAVYASGGSRVAYNDDVSSTNTDSRFAATLTAGRVYYFGVTNFTGTPAGAYTWKVDGPAPAAPVVDDAYEQNDTRLTAYNLGTPTATRTVNNLVMADAGDWYRFTTTVTGTTSGSVAINLQNAQGDLDLELYNAAGTRVRYAGTANNTETVSLSGLAAGTYYVRVFGHQGALNPNYALTIAPPGGVPAPAPSGSFDITLLTSGMTATQQAIFEQAAQRWESVITAALPAASYGGMTTTGVIINATATAIDGVGGILGQAGPDRFRPGSFLPYHGGMEFDTADLAGLQAGGGLLSTIMHEMGHVLGVGTIWADKGLLSGAGTTNPLFTGARATAEYNALFGRTATGVPLETTGGSGTRDSHWRESLFGNEIMTGYLNRGANPISRVTIASLADLGYAVDLTKADPYTPPGGGGSLLGGGGGSGTSLRALPRSANPGVVRQLALETLKAANVPTALTPRNEFSPVERLAGQARLAASADAMTPTAAPSPVAKNNAAKAADDVFADRLTLPRFSSASAVL